jgi:hypothetical protein
MGIMDSGNGSYLPILRISLTSSILIYWGTIREGLILWQGFGLSIKGSTVDSFELIDFADCNDYS